MLENFIYAKEKSLFEEALSNGNVLDEAIVFIEDTKEIWNHGTYFDCSSVDLSGYHTKEEIAAELVNYAKISAIPTKVSLLENDVPYALKSDVEVEVEVEVNAPNGVYAVSTNGELIDYNLADATAIGIAFISANQKVMIAKADATDGTNTKLYWGKNLYQQDVPNLENLADKTAAKADYNGKANTAAIIAGYAPLGKDMDSSDMCKVLETYNEGGYTDWYVPAAGQLYEFYSNKTAIEEALTAISGTVFTSGGYWSSSEESAASAWLVSFFNGNVYNYIKDSSSAVRFVRDLTLKKPLKERVSEIESQIGDINTILESIINGNPDTPDNSIKKMITFTVKSEMYPNLSTYTYEAEEGMTWEEFLNNSEYPIYPLHPQSFDSGTYVNCNGYDDNYVIYSSAKIAQLISYTIIDGEVYTYHDEK